MITFATPWLLCLLPLPFLVRLFLRPAARNLTIALKVPFFQRLATQFKQTASPKIMRWKMIFAGFIWSLLVISVAGPTWLGPAVTLPQTGRNIMLAIDLSGSMSLPDFTLGRQQATRLDVVKKVAGQFIQGRKGDRVGLIVFGSEPFVRSPLTHDLNYDQKALDDASIGLAGQMTAIGDAIGLAVKRLREVPEASRVLILLTDGGNNSGELTPLAAAQLAAKEHITIYTIGIGADRLVVPTMFGTQVINPSSDLDEATLEKMATITQGAFFRAKNTEALQEIYQKIDRLEPVNSDTRVFHPEIPLYPWPLFLALFMTIIFAVLSRKQSLVIRRGLQGENLLGADRC